MYFIKILFSIIGLTLLAAIVLYLAPKDAKIKTLAYLADSALLPTEAKKTIDDIFATPEIKAERLVNKIERNLAKIETAIQTAPSNPQPIIEVINETREVIKEAIAQKASPTFIQQITKTITEKIISSDNSCPQE